MARTLVIKRARFVGDLKQVRALMGKMIGEASSVTILDATWQLTDGADPQPLPDVRQVRRKKG